MGKAETYRVGAARGEITPSLAKKVYLAGFQVNRTAKGVLHPLTANALYVEDASGSALCLVALDLIGFQYPHVEQVRARVEHVLPRERVMVCATHTHAGPDTLGMWGKGWLGIPFRSGVDPEYMAFVVERAADVVEKAKADAKPAVLKVATFDTPPHWVRNERKGGGKYPRAVMLVAEQEGEEKPVVLLNFAAHPEALWDGNRLVSPDYPGPFRSWLERLGVRQALFFSGPLGAMLTPDVPLSARAEPRRAFIERFGRELADFTFGKLGAAVELAGPIRLVRRRLSLENRNPRFEWGKKLGLLVREIPAGKIETEMVAGSIGDWRFVTVPGEASPEVGDRLYDAIREGHRMIFALGNDELGYIIPAVSFAQREYRYEQSMSVGPHSAPTCVSTAYELVEELGK